MFTISKFNCIHRTIVIAGGAHATEIIGARTGDNITTR